MPTPKEGFAEYVAIVLVPCLIFAGLMWLAIHFRIL